MSRKGSRVVGRLGRNKDVDRLKQGLHRGQAFEGWLGQRAGINECFDSSTLSLQYENAFHQSPTKYIHGDPKISTVLPFENFPLSAEWLQGLFHEICTVVEDERCQLYASKEEETPSRSFLDRKFSFLRILSQTIQLSSNYCQTP